MFNFFFRRDPYTFNCSAIICLSDWIRYMTLSYEYFTSSWECLYNYLMHHCCLPVTTLLLTFLWKWKKMKVKMLSHVRLFATPWAVAHQAPPSMGFSRQEYWSELPFLSPGDLPDPGIEPRSPALWADALTSEPPGGQTFLWSLLIHLWICLSLLKILYYILLAFMPI